MQRAARLCCLLLQLASGLLSVLASTTGRSCNTSYLAATTIGSGALRTIPGLGAAECCAACTANSSCLAFVVDRTTCFLKSNLDDQHTKSGNTAGIVRGSAPVPPPPPPPPPPPAPLPQQPSFDWADSFGSHMVLQQLPAPTVVWGFADPGATISVHRQAGSHGAAPASATNTTAADGVWRVEMAGRRAGNETFRFTATSNGHSIEMDDVVYGDVWLCSGQSNMAVVTSQVFNASEVLQEASRYASMPTNPLR
jgi:hypothetical protein